MTPNPQDSAVALEVELLPCPFCGSAPDHIHVYFGEEIVRCSNEACPASPMSGGETEAEVFAAWNTRASQSDGTSGGWISVDERLPEHEQEVICTGFTDNDPTKKRWQDFAWFHKDGAFYDRDLGDELNPPTHWREMPVLPAAPNQGENHVG